VFKVKNTQLSLCECICIAGSDFRSVRSPAFPGLLAGTVRKRRCVTVHLMGICQAPPDFQLSATKTARSQTESPRPCSHRKLCVGILIELFASISWGHETSLHICLFGREYHRAECHGIVSTVTEPCIYCDFRPNSAWPAALQSMALSTPS